MIQLLMLFVLVAAIILLVVVLSSDKGNGLLELFGRAKLEINFEKKGWQKPSTKQKHQPIHIPARRQYRYWLEVKHKKWRFPLDERSAVYIGRKSDCTIQLTDPGTAPKQAVIYWEEGRYKINNLSSRHVLTKVNGRPITKQNLGHGNTIEMGRTKLIFRDRNKMKWHGSRK